MTERHVAIVVPGLATAGGVPAVAAFLYQVMLHSGKYKPALFSLPMSSRDRSSVRLISPASWFRGPQVTTGSWNGWPYKHIGAIGAELEFLRYQPRRILTEALSSYDLIQIVAGTPTWAYIASNVQRPVLLQVATLTLVERQALFRALSGARLIWSKFMSHMVTFIEDKALQELSAVFVENQWMFEHLSERIGASKVVFAPPGIDTERFFPGSYQAGSYILSVGRLKDPRKNISLLFRSYHRLRQIIPEAPRLILAGKSMPDSVTWSLAESLDIAIHIERLEDVSAKELAKLYRNASLFVLTSDEEGLGIVILEAMASGIPVVATRCGGPETAVQDGKTGYLTPVGDVEAVAIGMKQLLEDPVRAERLGKSGRKRVEREFSLDAAALRFLDKYDSILS